MSRIYFDNNASTSLCPSAKQAMIDYLNDADAFGNPSLPHWAGLATKDYLEQARSQVAHFIHCDANEVVFTSGGTEANNQAIYGAALRSLASNTPKRHIISSVIEHSATLNPLANLVKHHGFEVSYVEVDAQGFFKPEDVAALYREDTFLVSLMQANNEFGTIEPIATIGRWCRQHDILFHVDAVCSAGKLDIDVQSLGADLLSLSAHKFYGPKGAGALYIREQINERVAPLILGAGQQRQRRSGTASVILAVGMGAACHQLQQMDLIAERQRRQQLCDSLYQQLHQTLGERLILNGTDDPQQRLSNTLNVSFIGHNGLELLIAVGDQLAFSAGKACSNAILRLGKNDTTALGAVRFSLGTNNTQQDVDDAVLLLLEALTTPD